MSCWMAWHFAANAAAAAVSASCSCCRAARTTNDPALSWRKVILILKSTCFLLPAPSPRTVPVRCLLTGLSLGPPSGALEVFLEGSSGLLALLLSPLTSSDAAACGIPPGNPATSPGVECSLKDALSKNLWESFSTMPLCASTVDASRPRSLAGSPFGYVRLKVCLVLHSTR